MSAQLVPSGVGRVPTPSRVAAPAYRRVVHRPPWCPGDAVPHTCNCGVCVTHEPLPGGPAPARVTLPPRWYRGANARAIGFWFTLVVELSLAGAYAFARDALSHGFTLTTFHAWCLANGFAG
ncbi:MAG: hypothetical protein PVJ57_08635 [Phycisphaerae bacterium]